jgi:hypothetical protein
MPQKRPSSSSSGIYSYPPKRIKRGARAEEDEPDEPEEQSEDSQEYYAIKDIIDEKGGKYKVDWAGKDPKTGKSYEPTWVRDISFLLLATL